MTLRANELRIGNIVLNDRVENTIVAIAEPLNIVGLRTPQGNLINADIELIKPIPLTEELIMKIRCRYHEDNLRMEFRMTPPGERQVENNYWSNEVHDFAKLHLSPSYRSELIGDLRVKSKVPEFWFIWITSCGTGSSWFMSLMDIRGHTLRYLHQLQNLYFDLTGKELTIK
jgi:hypothetical protein